MVTYSDMSPSCSLMFKFIGPEEITRSIIVDLIPVCGLGGSVVLVPRPIYFYVGA